MRILILNHAARLSPRLASEARTLAAASHAVQVLNWCRSREEKSRAAQVDGGLGNYDFIVARAPKASALVAAVLPWLYAKVLWRLRAHSFAVVHCTHLMLLPLALLLGWRKKARVVYDAYEFHAVDLSAYVPRAASLVRKALETCENWLAARADCILTVDSVGDALASRYRRYNPNVHVLFNVPEDGWGNPADRTELLRKKHTNQRLIFSVGGILRQKGALQAIEAMHRINREVPSARLIFIGALEKWADEVRAFAEKSPAARAVEFVDWLEYPELLSYLRLGEVGLALYLPTPQTRLAARGNARKLFTYMQAGLPIVAPDFGEIGAVVREEQCGLLVDSTDPERIADAVLYLLQHSDEARAMGARGRKAFLARYNWSVESKKLLSAYESLASETARSTARTGGEARPA